MDAKEKIDELIEITNNKANNNNLTLQNDYYRRKTAYIALNEDIIKKIYEDLQNNKKYRKIIGKVRKQGKQKTVFDAKKR